MKQNNAILIFRKNEIQGKVKTRIAKDCNEQMALEIYKTLCSKTIDVCNESTIPIIHYYSDFIPEQHIKCINRIQHGEDLGERMCNAFLESFEEYDKLILVGTDCPYIEASDIHLSIELLEKKDVVLGPCPDGGYYLIAMNRIHKSIFKNIEWSSEKVMRQTCAILDELKLDYAFTPEHKDIDNLNDWQNYEQGIK
ncbi:MAG: TIGR04282 family arsenosugar biosynthesis glycosyltransferase [Saprospiraceae bacterium]